jgi:hypothetical protein
MYSLTIHFQGKEYEDVKGLYLHHIDAINGAKAIHVERNDPTIRAVAVHFWDGTTPNVILPDGTDYKHPKP